MTIAVDWDIKRQQTNKQISMKLKKSSLIKKKSENENHMIQVV